MASTNSNIVIKDIPVQTADVAIKSRLPKGKIAALLGAIENNDSIAESGAIIHITSTYNNEGADLIALETALFAATQEGKNVLLIDANPGSQNAATKAGLRPAVSLDEYVLENAKSNAPLVHINNTTCVYAKFSSQDVSGNLLLNTRILRELLKGFRDSYDLVIIHSQDALKSGAGSILAPLTDASIITIQADRTRMPAVEELIEIITSSGGAVSGTIMSGRKYYIPSLVYKLFFGGKSRD